MRNWTALLRAGAAAAILMAGMAAQAQQDLDAEEPAGATLKNEELVAKLREGGYVIVMRIGDDNDAPPEAGAASADNEDLAPELTGEGVAEAEGFGAALRGMDIPIGEVITSPAYRARQTADVANLGNLQTDPHLAIEGGDTFTVSATEWLRQQAYEAPAAGRNRLLITHIPNISRAFPNVRPRPEPGEALIFDPALETRAPGPTLVARVRVDQWVELREQVGAD